MIGVDDTLPVSEIDFTGGRLGAVDACVVDGVMQCPVGTGSWCIRCTAQGAPISWNTNSPRTGMFSDRCFRRLCRR